MSAAVLTSDNSNWRPTVVQIAPFVHDQHFSASRPSTSSSSQTNSDSTTEKRNYPVLAVTRSNSCITTGSEDVNKGTQDVPFSGRPPTEFIKSFYGGKFVASHSKKLQIASVKKCWVQDLNTQNNDTLSDSQSECQMDQSQFLATSNSDSVKSVLSERKYFYGTNVIMRNLKPTPGELDLQMRKEKYASEQAQKRKKYKLNVNQLPRSTTPINDHDPDKLNMKQVIQFLQNKNGSKVIPPKQAGKVSINSDSQKTIGTTGLRPQSEVTASNQRPPTDSVRSSTDVLRDDTKSDSESRIASRNSCYSRDSFGSRSILSTQSVPIMDSREKRTHSKRHTPSSKSVKDRSRHSRRSVKEFKLYRFLALAPNGMGQTTVPDSHTLDQLRSKEKQKEKAIDDNQNRVAYRAPIIREQVPAYQFSENKLQGNKISAKDEIEGNNGERKTTKKTSHLMRRRALLQYREKFRMLKAENLEEEGDQRNTIRLPSVHDYDDNVRSHESEDEETVPNEIFSYPEDTVKIQDLSLLSSRSDQTNNRSVNYQSPLLIQTTYVDNNNNNKNKRLSVNIPQQSDKTTKEVIKLTLRKEKDVTREQSYMHDIATPRDANMYTMMCQHLKQSLPPTFEDDCGYDRRIYRISAVAINEEDDNYNILPDEATLAVHETLANSCIKVRQKLKGTVHND